MDTVGSVNVVKDLPLTQVVMDLLVTSILAVALTPPVIGICTTLLLLT